MKQKGFDINCCMKYHGHITQHNIVPPKIYALHDGVCLSRHATHWDWHATWKRKHFNEKGKNTPKLFSPYFMLTLIPIFQVFPIHFLTYINFVIHHVFSSKKMRHVLDATSICLMKYGRWHTLMNLQKIKEHEECEIPK